MAKLLANPKAREKVIKNIVKHGPKVSIFSYIIGMIWMISLPHHELSARNYFSENQLLPGLVDTHFSLTHYSHTMYNKLGEKCRQSNAHLKRALAREFYRLGFDVHEQKFYVPGKSLNGSNVYGVFRSPRASGVESIILNVPLHEDCSSVGSLALMAGIASHFREQTYWAKDIIFLVTEYELDGIQAWLNGYFQDRTPGIVADDLHGHGGSIQAAVVLDFPGYLINYFDVEFVGANGLLPNLDFVNLMHRIAALEGVPCKFRHQTQLYQHREHYTKNLEALLRMMAVQSSGYPTGNHGMFYKYRIEAVTLRGMNNELQRRHRKDIRFEQIGRMVEGIFRSINNMLEHFHQSFFLYVLPNTYTYISIGMYMPPLGFLVLPLAIHLMILWIKIFKLDCQENKEQGNNDVAVVENPAELEAREELLNQDRENESEESSEETDVAKTNKETSEVREGPSCEENKNTLCENEDQPEIDGTCKESKQSELVAMTSLLDMQVPVHVFLSLTLSQICCYGLTYYFDHVNEYSPSASQLFFVLFAACYGAVIVVQFSSNSENQNLKFFALLYLTLLIAVTSIFNFSAAFVVGSFYVPQALILVTPGVKYRKLLQIVVSLITSPPILTGFVVLMSKISLENFDIEDVWTEVLPRWKDVMIDAHVETSLPIWTRDLFYLTVLPVWITLSSLT